MADHKENFRRHVAAYLKKSESDAEVGDLVDRYYDEQNTIQEDIAAFDAEQGQAKSQAYRENDKTSHRYTESANAHFKKMEEENAERQEEIDAQREEREFYERAKKYGKERHTPESLPGEARARDSKFQKTGAMTEEEAILSASEEIGQENPEKESRGIIGDLIAGAESAYEEHIKKPSEYAKHKEQLKTESDILDTIQRKNELMDKRDLSRLKKEESELKKAEFEDSFIGRTLKSFNKSPEEKLRQLQEKRLAVHEKAMEARARADIAKSEYLVGKYSQESSSPFKAAIRGGGKAEVPFWMRGTEGPSGVMEVAVKGGQRTYLGENRGGMSPFFATATRQQGQRTGGHYQTVIAYDPVLRRRVAKRVYVGGEQPQAQGVPSYAQSAPMPQQSSSSFMRAVFEGPSQAPSPTHHAVAVPEHKSMLQEAMFGEHKPNMPEHKSQMQSAMFGGAKVRTPERKSALMEAMEYSPDFMAKGHESKLGMAISGGKRYKFLGGY